ncbi:radical SAM protein [Fundidesulfovibrio butyratiphilus]
MRNVSHPLSPETVRHEPAHTPALVRGMTPFSLCDWPGRTAAVVYVGGCNLRCPGCHNGSLAWTPHRHAPKPLGEVLAFLARRKPWLDGVVVCGGEPTADPGLESLVAALVPLGLPLKVDTNGTRPDVVHALLETWPGLCLSVDLKGPWEMYPALTGGALAAETARASLTRCIELAAAHPGRVAFRITLDPMLTGEDVARVRAVLPDGMTLREQPFVAPKRGGETPYASSDQET